ncbi:MAG: hypothetical protein U0V75_11890 [Ferruginibacter sp.]
MTALAELFFDCMNVQQLSQSKKLKAEKSGMAEECDADEAE